MKIVLLEDLSIPQEVLDSYKSQLEAKGHEFVSYTKSSPEEQKERIQDADIVMIANTPLRKDVIESAPNLKYIDIAFTGVDHVDVESAKDKGVLVSNAAGYSTESVAELAIALMIMLLRSISENETRLRNGGTKAGLRAQQLNTKTVGIIGVGAIGTRVAELLHAFGSKILGYKRHLRGDEPDYIKFVDLNTLLSESDIVTLHVPGNNETKDLIDQEAIDKMKDGAILINTARGPVIDQEAVTKALKSGKLGGAGIDVFSVEPPVTENEVILEAPNTVLTPHIGFFTEEAMIKRAEIVFENIEKFLDGDPQNLV